MTPYKFPHAIGSRKAWAEPLPCRTIVVVEL